MSCGLQFWIIRQSSSVTVSCRWRIRQRPQTIENISRVRRQIFNMLKIWRRKNIRCDSVHVSLATATLISLTLIMPWKTVCSRYEVIIDSQVFVGVRCQRLLTNKQREETSRAEPWRHIATSNDLGVTITCEFCPEGYVWWLLITCRLRVPAALQRCSAMGYDFETMAHGLQLFSATLLMSVRFQWTVRYHAFLDICLMDATTVFPHRVR